VLPASPPPVTEALAAEARVLVADTDRAELSALCWLLRERGYAVTSVGDPQLLVDAPEQIGDADLLVLDLEDRGLLRRIKEHERWRDVPVLVTTPTPTPEAAAAVLRDGAADCVAKPLRVAELLARVEAQLRLAHELRAARSALRDREVELQRAREDVASTQELVDIVHEVAGELSTTSIYRIIARRVARALDISRCSVVLASAGDAVGTVAVAHDDPSIRNLEIRLERYPEIMRALETGRPVLVEDAWEDALFADTVARWRSEGSDVQVRSVVALPFSLDRWRAGVLFLRTTRAERALTTSDVEFAEVVVNAAVAAIKRTYILESTRADNRRLEALATTDPLTRLLNRRALLERLSSEVDRSLRYGDVLTLLMVDVDHFKNINDSHGHLVGDAVLREIGSLLHASVRAVDVVARYGGEEFVIILPETPLEGALVFAERLRETIERHGFAGRGGAGLRLTASIGAATFPSPHVHSTEDLFARADEALYRAKSGGRNQVRT
jgi:two-component system cell cycle response regulator